MQQRKKSLCEATGHDWKATGASNYRVCQRSNCRAAQRKAGETWIDVPLRTRPAPVAQGEQAALWG